jgi:hypothetical protein
LLQISREIRARCEAPESLVADAVGNEQADAGLHSTAVADVRHLTVASACRPKRRSSARASNCFYCARADYLGSDDVRYQLTDPYAHDAHAVALRCVRRQSLTRSTANA